LESGEDLKRSRSLGPEQDPVKMLCRSILKEWKEIIEV
jgi:hypothetical protein